MKRRKTQEAGDAGKNEGQRLPSRRCKGWSQRGSENDRKVPSWVDRSKSETKRKLDQLKAGTRVGLADPWGRTACLLALGRGNPSRLGISIPGRGPPAALTGPKDLVKDRLAPDGEIICTHIQHFQTTTEYSTQRLHTQKRRPRGLSQTMHN